MARYTSTYCSFISRLDEVTLLTKFASQKEIKDPVGLRREIDALCRGSVVLLSAHLEAYIKELGELALTSLHSNSVSRSKIDLRIYYHISKDVLDEIKETDDPLKLAGKVFDFLGNDSPYWSKVGSFPQPIPTERFNKGFSNPAYSKIKSYFNRFGYSDFDRDLARVLRGSYQPIVNMVDHLVDTRNKIAHGNPSATKTPNDVKQMVLMIKSFCNTTDAVFGKWWKVNFCSIR
jgi:hypothetical protein